MFDHSVEISVDPIDRVNLLASAVDRTGQTAQVILYHGFQDAIGSPVEVGTVIDPKRDVSVMSMAQDRFEIFIEEYFSPVG